MVPEAAFTLSFDCDDIRQDGLDLRFKIKWERGFSAPNMAVSGIKINRLGTKDGLRRWLEALKRKLTNPVGPS